MRYNELTEHYFRAALARTGLEHEPDAAAEASSSGAAGSTAQGTWVRFEFELAGGCIRAARFNAFGCPHTLAVCAWITELVAGRPLDAALPTGLPRVRELFALPVHKLGRLLVIEDAWRAAAAASKAAQALL